MENLERREERINEAVSELVQAVDHLLGGEGTQIIIGLQASDEYPYRVDLKNETLPFVGLTRVQREPATRERSSSSVTDPPSSRSKRG